jgi:hypothetical protein
MSNSAVIEDFRKGIKYLEHQVFETGRLSGKAALQLAIGLAVYHPFVGVLPVAGGATNKDFRLTGMIIEDITISSKGPVESQISVAFKDPDSYHKDLFLDEAVEFASKAAEDELDAILTESGL